MRNYRAAALIAMLVAACGARGNNDPGSRAAGDAAVVIVRGSEITGTLIEGLRSRVPGMRVVTGTAGCPLIVLRGVRSARNQGNPSVYVDGTMMTDTCILQQITALDVDRVEIYPSGNPPNPGLQHNPFGIIIVYRVTR